MQWLGSAFSHLGDAATSTLAFVAYGVAVLAGIALSRQLAQNRFRIRLIEKLPKGQRDARVREIILQPIPAEISGEQWLENQRNRLWVAALALVCGTIVAVVAIALFRLPVPAPNPSPGPSGTVLSPTPSPTNPTPSPPRSSTPTPEPTRPSIIDEPVLNSSQASLPRSPSSGASRQLMAMAGNWRGERDLGCTVRVEVTPDKIIWIPLPDRGPLTHETYTTAPIAEANIITATDERGIVHEFELASNGFKQWIGKEGRGESFSQC